MIASCCRYMEFDIIIVIRGDQSQSADQLPTTASV